MGKIIGLTFPLPQQEEANTQGKEPHDTESD